MIAKLENFKTGWFGLALGLQSDEIDLLIDALKTMKAEKGHFHFRSGYEGDSGIGDIEFYLHTDDQPCNLELDTAIAIY